MLTKYQTLTSIINSLITAAATADAVTVAVARSFVSPREWY